MYCPKCRSEYRAGILRCTPCEVDLINELPASDPFASAESMAALLADRDVEALVVGQHPQLRELQRVFAERRIATVIAGEASEEIEPGLHARFYLMVDVAQLEEARRVLGERWAEGVAREGLMLPPAKSTDDAAACPACGAAVPASASECPDCGLFLGADET